MKVDIDSLSKSYGNVKALTDVNLRLGEGVYALLGPNGAGKSTLMNILAGNLKPDSGKVSFQGRLVQEMRDEDRSRIGFMPQRQLMYDNFSVLRFLSYIAALKGLSKSDAVSQINELLSELNLADFKQRRLSACSGGMRQRVLLAQSLLGKPDLLILDEPTAGLDPAERIRVKNLIAEYGKKRTVLLSTHIVSDVEEIAKNVSFIKKGKIILSDKCENLLSELIGRVIELSLPAELADAFVSYVHKTNELHKRNLRFSDSDINNQHFIIRAIKNEGDVWTLRLLLSFPAELPNYAKAVPPDLEDLYMLYFQYAPADA